MAVLLLKSVSGDKQAELRGQIIAGRSEDSDLVLTEGHPSRRHAQITVSDDGVWIEDLGSTNGTYVNGRKLDSRVKLGPGDRVRFDLEEFDVVEPAAEPAAPDPNATVLRAQPPSVTTEPAAAPEPAPAPDKPQGAAEKGAAAPATREVESGGGTRRPGAWADPNQIKAGGTVLFDKDQLQALLAEAQPSPQPLPDADTAYLVVTAGAQAGTTVKLKPGRQTNVWDIGRDADRDIRFDEDGVSGFHAKIVNEGARWKIIDQMSANGTLVNENRGTISFLAPGDRIRFGPVECVFQLPAGAKGKRSARAAGRGSEPGRSGSRLLWAGLVAAVVVIAAAAAYYYLTAG